MPETSNRTPMLYLLAIGVPPFIVTAYWWWTYALLYRWIAEFQLALFGRYLVNLTFFLTYIPLVSGMVALASILTRSFRIHLDRSQVDTYSFRVLDGLNELHVRLFALGVGICCVGLIMFALAVSAGAWTTGAVGDLEKGVARTSNRLVLDDGRLLVENAVEWSEGSSSHVYVPLVTANWKASDPIAVVVSFRADELDDRHSDHCKGSVNSRGLAGHVRASFEKQGLRLVDVPIELVNGADIGDTSRDGFVILVGILFMLLAAAIRFFKMKRRSAAPQPNFG